MSPKETAPLEAVERLYQELVAEYRARHEHPELRAAKDLLLVALARMRAHGGAQWLALLDEYRDAAVHHPDRFERIVESNRGRSSRR
jgi:hypothetical protein